MKLIAELDSEQHEIVIRRDGRKVLAKIGDREYKLEASRPEPNVYLLKADNRIYEIFIAPADGASEQKESPRLIKTADGEFEISIHDPKRLRGAQAEADGADGVAEIKTAMPGKLVRILAGEGTEIKSGEGVLVVEAMKMQNEMKSPKDGIIKEIRFAEGDTVNAGEILAVIE